MTSGTKHRKRRSIRYIILGCLCLLPLLSYLETRVFQVGTIPFPVNGNVLVFLLININVLLLLLMVFLVLRRLVELAFERKRRILGAKLRTKLVLSFVSMSLIPTAILFFIALQFVSTSMDYWFNSNVEQSLQESLNIAQSIYQEGRQRVKSRGGVIAGELAATGALPDNLGAVERLLKKSLTQEGPDGLELLSDQRQPILTVLGERLAGQQLPQIPPDLFRLALDDKDHQTTIQSIDAGDLVRSVFPVTTDQSANRPYLLITSLLIPRRQLERMDIISSGIEGYRQLMLFKTPIKTSLLIMLLIVSLLIVFSAIWFGFYVAQGLTGPIGKLADATRRVADGELDFVLPRESDDEMGLLVDSFNRMTSDLSTGKQQLEETNRALQESYQELDSRQQYTETILQNVAAGVISLDADGKVTTINLFAENLLQIRKEHYLNKDYRTILPQPHLDTLEGFLAELADSGKPSIQRPLRLSVRNETFSLLVSFTKLEDDDHKPLGVVMVFDNLTQLEKVQRIAAWREVAKRIAHEVKNPLTPIQLSAQRLRKRYLDTLGADGEVLELCTRTIINQVDELKRLVSEFSNFARMPAVQMSLNSLPEMAREVLVLYEESHKGISFTLNCPEIFPSFNYDPKQMKRVLINLIDNAIAALPDGGSIEITLTDNSAAKAAFIEVKDNGPGIPDEDKPRLFQPYFSTKKSGTGLGLAIANSIVADHGGYLRIRDNQPHGAIFTVELPITT